MSGARTICTTHVSVLGCEKSKPETFGRAGGTRSVPESWPCVCVVLGGKEVGEILVLDCERSELENLGYWC